MKAGKVIGKVAGIGLIGGAIAGIAYMNKKNYEKSSVLEGRYKSYYQLANQWLMNKNEGKPVIRYFEDNDIKSVAIYGMGTLGELFYEEVKDSDIKVGYFIDKNSDILCYGMDEVPITSLEGISEQEQVDAIIVTPVFDFDAIQEDLEKVTDIHLISLEDVVYGL